jgi:hypothetical protein
MINELAIPEAARAKMGEARQMSGVAAALAKETAATAVAPARRRRPG